MAKKTYTIGVNSQGQITYTTFKVWVDAYPIRSRTFPTLSEAKEFYEENEGTRLDKIVTTIIEDGI